MPGDVPDRRKGDAPDSFPKLVRPGLFGNRIEELDVPTPGHLPVYGGGSMTAYQALGEAGETTVEMGKFVAKEGAVELTMTLGWGRALRFIGWLGKSGWKLVRKVVKPAGKGKELVQITIQRPAAGAPAAPGSLPSRQVGLGDVENLARAQAGRTHDCFEAADEFFNQLPAGTGAPRNAGGHCWTLVNTNQGLRYVDTSGFTIARARAMGLNDLVRRLEQNPVFTPEEWQSLMQQLGLQ